MLARNQRHKLTIAQTTVSSSSLWGTAAGLSSCRESGSYFASQHSYARTVTIGCNSYLRGHVKREHVEEPTYCSAATFPFLLAPQLPIQPGISFPRSGGFGERRGGDKRLAVMLRVPDNNDSYTFCGRTSAYSHLALKF